MLDYINGFIQKFWTYFIELLGWFLDQFLTLMGSLFFFILDGFLMVIEGIVNGLDFAIFDTLAVFESWSLLPDSLIWLLNRLCITQCLTVLAAAYTIRFALNLIPGAFTRV